MSSLKYGCYHIYLGHSLAGEVDKRAPKRERSSFIREAIREKIERESSATGKKHDAK